MGEYDLVGRALESAGMRLLFHKVAVKPGKPVLAGRRGACLVFGVPGNPVSAFTCYSVFVAPVQPEQRRPAFALVDRLRRGGLQADTDYEDKSLKAMFKAADKRGAQLMVILGPDELERGEVKVKDFRSGDEIALPDDARLPQTLLARLARTEPES